ncbi:MAG TPA: glycosyltransferase family 4 protein [Bryobacteraceae bacterium]|jgi:glycosyltransferase involved in cell wall biosynthesis|nr:glycosyltransferase family 4 protein [Bryobacteraceae bacterium]
MDRANLALAEYLLEQRIPVHVVAHEVDACLEEHPLAHVRLVPRPAGSFMLGEFPLAFYGRRAARRVQKKWPRAQVVVNGGNCIWPGINWAHYVHHAMPAPPQASAPWLFRIKDALSGSRARRTERAAFQCARLVITNSERTSREVIQYFGVEKSRVHTVYLGTDPDWGLVTHAERAASRQALEIPETRAVAVFVGALGYDHRKGFDVLFRAWEELCVKRDWNVDLLVAGAGPALPMWRTSVQQAGLADRIRFLGFSEQVKSVLATADVLVSPVRYESYGLNVQEAICRGIPAMVSASAGVAERYESDCAPMLIPNPEDANDLVQRLLAWRPKKDEWKSRFQPFGDRLRSRSWRDTAVDIVSIACSGEVKSIVPMI